METKIFSAIKAMKLITFHYDGSLREVEPHQVGYDHDGDLTLSAWQISGGSGVGWRDFHTAKITGLAATAGTFARPRPGYNPQNRKMARILCGL